MILKFNRYLLVITYMNFVVLLMAATCVVKLFIASSYRGIGDQ